MREQLPAEGRGVDRGNNIGNFVYVFETSIDEGARREAREEGRRRKEMLLTWSKGKNYGAELPKTAQRLVGFRHQCPRANSQC